MGGWFVMQYQTGEVRSANVAVFFGLMGGALADVQPHRPTLRVHAALHRCVAGGPPRAVTCKAIQQVT
jgi:hypothetical protein